MSSVAIPEAAAHPAAEASSTTADPAGSGKSRLLGATASPIDANAQADASKSAKKVLVDDTVTDAQLKQILAKGYRPDRQAPGNEVYYCRSEQLSGERFQTKVCKTAARILEDERRGRDLINSVEQISLQTER
jgi:hypothetical protein